MKQKYIKTFGNAYEISSIHSKELLKIVYETCNTHGIMCTPDDCFQYLHEFPQRYVQESLFGNYSEP